MCAVCIVLCDVRRDMCVCMCTLSDRTVVCGGDDIDTVEEITLTSDILLEGGRGSTTYVHFTIEDGELDGCVMCSIHHHMPSHRTYLVSYPNQPAHRTSMHEQHRCITRPYRQQSTCQFIHIRTHNLGCIRTCKCPYDIACSITHMRTDGVCRGAHIE